MGTGRKGFSAQEKQKLQTIIGKELEFLGIRHEQPHYSLFVKRLKPTALFSVPKLHGSSNS